MKLRKNWSTFQINNRMASLTNIVFMIVIPTLISLSNSAQSSSKALSCKTGYFFESSTEKCQRCSECPVNQVIHTPCSNISDVKCEPLSIAIFQSSDMGQKEGGFQFVDVDEDYSIDNDHIPLREDDSLMVKYSKESDQGPATVEKGDREYWKKLALALIGALSVLIILATIIVTIAWIKVQRASVAKLPEDGETDDTDSGYVVIRSIRYMAFPRVNAAAAGGNFGQDCDDAHPPLLQSESPRESTRSTSSHQQESGSNGMCYLPKVYKPQRRLLNYDADDVFESDDNSVHNATFNSKASPALSSLRREPRR